MHEEVFKHWTKYREIVNDRYKGNALPEFVQNLHISFLVGLSAMCGELSKHTKCIVESNPDISKDELMQKQFTFVNDVTGEITRMMSHYREVELTRLHNGTKS